MRVIWGRRLRTRGIFLEYSKHFYILFRLMSNVPWIPKLVIFPLVCCLHRNEGVKSSRRRTVIVDMLINVIALPAPLAFHSSSCGMAWVRLVKKESFLFYLTRSSVIIVNTHLTKVAQALNRQIVGLPDMPDTRYPVPDTRYPIPGTRYPIPDTRHPAPDTRHPAPDTRHPAPDTRHPIPDTRPPIPNTRYPIPDIRYPAPDTRYPIPDTRHPIPEFCKCLQFVPF